MNDTVISFWLPRYVCKLSLHALLIHRARVTAVVDAGAVLLES
jgi:hypothetical protein